MSTPERDITATTAWRAPLCRRPDEHPEVEHNWESLAKLGKRCSCFCHEHDGSYGDTA